MVMLVSNEVALIFNVNILRFILFQPIMERLRFECRMGGFNCHPMNI
jgi:hypothetical protein